MGKIFGICDNPVSTISSAIKPLTLNPPKVNCTELPAQPRMADKFVSKEKNCKSNPFIKMRNGFGKLMSHFSHVRGK